MKLQNVKYTYMMKKYLTLILFAGLSLGMPLISRASASIEIVEQVLQNVDISVQGSILHVTGASGLEINIYNVTGVRVKSFRVDSNDKRYDLNLPKGCYIVKVGKTVRKISIR